MIVLYKGISGSGMFALLEFCEPVDKKLYRLPAASWKRAGQNLKKNRDLEKYVYRICQLSDNCLNSTANNPANRRKSQDADRADNVS